MQLERAGEWATARGLVNQIDRESRDELPVIPLWQLADHYAWRDRLKGPGDSAAGLYQGIETWEIAPWVARDPWNSALKRPYLTVIWSVRVHLALGRAARACTAGFTDRG